MKALKKVAVVVLAIGMYFSFSFTSVSAANKPAYIPLQISMTPHDIDRSGTSTQVKKELNWYESEATKFYVTYRDGNGEYHMKNKVYTGYYGKTQNATYILPSGRTTASWNDYFSVRGQRNTVSTTGTITLTRYVAVK